MWKTDNPPEVGKYRCRFDIVVLVNGEEISRVHHDSWLWWFGGSDGWQHGFTLMSVHDCPNCPRADQTKVRTVSGPLALDRSCPQVKKKRRVQTLTGWGYLPDCERVRTLDMENFRYWDEGVELMRFWRRLDDDDLHKILFGSRSSDSTGGVIQQCLLDLKGIEAGPTARWKEEQRSALQMLCWLYEAVTGEADDGEVYRRLRRRNSEGHKRNS